MPRLTEKQKKAIVGGTIAAAGAAIAAWLLLKKKPIGGELGGAVGGQISIGIEPMTPEEAQQLLGYGKGLAQVQYWDITISGQTFKNVVGLWFRPTVRHKAGTGVLPITVQAGGLADSASLKTQDGRTIVTVNITTNGQQIRFSDADRLGWVPTSPGSYTLKFRFLATDSAGQTGQAEVTLSANVSAPAAPAPEIEVTVEIETR
ncbi:MAG: hypothetical protein QXH51_07900 [Candidatus Bathyarchaeia archaeon]